MAQITETGTIDLKAQKAGHDDAAKTATDYITEISAADGVKVHSAGNTSTFVQIASTFIDFVRSGVSGLKLWLDGTAAKVRVGLENAGHSIFSSEGMEVYTDSTTKVAKFGADGAQVGKDSNCVKVESNGIGLVNDSMKAVKVSSTVTQYIKQGIIDFLPDETGTTGNAQTGISGGWYNASSTEVSDIEIFAAAPNQVGASVLVESNTDGTNRVKISPELYVDGKVNNHSALKTLWSGTWSSGTLKVAGISGYKMLEISFASEGTHAQCFVTGSGTNGYVRGSNSYCTAGTITDYIVGLDLNMNTDTLTWKACKKRPMTISSKAVGTIANLTVTSIIGIL